MPAMGSNNNTPCACCMRAVKWVPVIFIVSIIVWSYYAYVVQLCVYTMESTAEEVILLIFYHLLFAIFLWSYWQTIYSPVGKVPPKWRIADSDIEKLGHAESQIQQKVILEILAKDLPVSNRTISGAVRFCDKCQIIKPDRAHHCSVCGICVLKMDHHCPWVNNCVNFTNYKYFVLFLGYALVYCIYVALTSLQYFIKFWEGELTGGMGRFHILFLFFVAVMFAISLVSLFGYHIYLVLLNRTTLEAFRAPIFRVGGSDKNGYNLGSCRNFKQVFGDDWRLWFLPIYTSSGDGMIYPMQSQHQLSTSYESMGDTPTRLDDSNAKFICNNSINSPDDAVIVNLNLLPITNQNNDASGDNGDSLLNPIQNTENSLMIKRNSSSHHEGGGSTEAWSTPKLNAVDSNSKNPDDNHEQITFR